LAQQAVQKYREALGEQHSNYTTSLNNLAGLYREQGEYAKAARLVAQLQDTCQHLAQLTLAAVKPEQRPARTKRLGELNEQKERLETELAKVSAQFRRSQTAPGFSVAWVHLGEPVGPEHADQHPPTQGLGSLGRSADTPL
jgi:hypothetical protein